MKHPSIKTRLIFGSTVLVAVVLLFSKIAMYHEVERSLRQEMDDQLLHSATLLSKSAELEAGGVIYEWQEALNSTAGLNIEGLFQFWDLKSDVTTRSPDLGDQDLKFFHGELNRPVYEYIQLPNGRQARALGFLHLPFTNEYGREEMRRRGNILNPADFPQVIVCAKETVALEHSLESTRTNLWWTGFFTLVAIWLAVLWITHWTLLPLNKLATSLLKRSSEVGTPLPDIPDKLPRELVPLASAFRTNLERVETARSHEKDFALSAAHQMRTPVAGLQAILEQALSRPREIDNLRERITKALEVTSEIRHTIESLMELARLKGGIDQIDPVEYDPAEIVLQLVEAEQERTGEWHRVELPQTIPETTILGDARLFRILASIMMENAFRHTAVGGRIWIGMEMQGDHFALSVSNEADFDPADSERIFRPFQRGKNTSVNSPGAGLGLALAREISQRLDATLEVSFKDDSVVSFEVKLPDGFQNAEPMSEPKTSR